MEFNDRVKIVNIKEHICKEDSLREVVYNLKSELEIAEDGWDKKEQRYEDILFEYEYGIGQLKEYRPEAYRYFHRIIGYRERFSREVEIENKKRLNSSKW
jgi:hypothetical protein